MNFCKNSIRNIKKFRVNFYEVLRKINVKNIFEKSNIVKTIVFISILWYK